MENFQSQVQRFPNETRCPRVHLAFVNKVYSPSQLAYLIHHSNLQYQCEESDCKLYHLYFDHYYQKGGERYSEFQVQEGS